MDLSYEETMRRIEDYGTNGPRFTNGEPVHKFCKQKKYPYCVEVYMGEGKIIVSPLITCIGYYSVHMAWHICIPDTSDMAAIGRAAFEGLEHIKASPVDARTRKGLYNEVHQMQVIQRV